MSYLGKALVLSAEGDEAPMMGAEPNQGSPRALESGAPTAWLLPTRQRRVKVGVVMSTTATNES